MNNNLNTHLNTKHLSTWLQFGVVFVLAFWLNGCIKATTASSSVPKPMPVATPSIQSSADEGEDLREDKRYAKDDWRAYSDYDRFYNLAVLKLLGKPKSSVVDDTVWVYTSSFAKRFGMPKRWIGDKDFKGALALAYRVELIGRKTCGYFGDWNNCREIDTRCLLDVYTNHDSKTIPWNTKNQSGIAYGGGQTNDTSRFWLRSFKYRDGKRRKQNFGLSVLANKREAVTPQSFKDLEHYRGFSLKNTRPGIDSISWAHRFKKDGFGEGSGGRVIEFHRNVLDGIDLITIGGMCNFASSGDAEMQIDFSSENEETAKNREYNNNNFYRGKRPGHLVGNHRNMKVNHRIYPGKNFMQRVKAYDTANKKHGFFEFFKKNINKSKPTTKE